MLYSFIFIYMCIPIYIPTWGLGTSGNHLSPWGPLRPKIWKKYNIDGMKYHTYGIKYNIYDQKWLKYRFNHIKYDDKYMPELFLTPPEPQHNQND